MKGMTVLFFLLTWLLILAGAIETVWGLCQVYGYTASNHSLYALTGSFYNPGPYSGFLAMCLPVCLHEWLKQGKSIGGYIALGVLLLMWKVSVQAIKEKPLSGYGWDYVAGVYGEAQEKYFSKGDYTEQEERVAGSPEYVFNEYLQAAMAWGVPVLCVILLLVIAAMTGHHVSGNYGLFGAMLSLSVFSFSSYPFQFPLFVAAFGLLVLTGLSGWLRFFPVALSFPVILCWAVAFMEVMCISLM